LGEVRLDGPAEVEVVGAGITGCSCALTLARAGLRVRVHDARQVAGGASGRNGGFALRGGAMAYDDARAWLGAQPAHDFWTLTEQYLDELAAIGGNDLQRPGSLRIAADDEEREEIRREYDALREDGFAAEWRTPDELAPPLRQRFTGAIFHPHDGVLQPARVVRRVAALAFDAGAEIREHHRVESLDDLEAERVVVATDGYPSGLLGELEGSIVPTRGQMIATEPIDERLFACPHYGRHGFDYWHQNVEGRVIAGGFRDFALDSEFTADEATTPAIQQALDDFVAELVGRRLEVTHRWAGIFGLVLDFLPVVGRHPRDERVWISGGYSGHGNVLGFMCGDLLGRALLGEEHPLLALFSPSRLLQLDPR
jgi:glycine/D-amino acid oxidase-like deaminating enzyme